MAKLFNHHTQGWCIMLHAAVVRACTRTELSRAIILFLFLCCVSETAPSLNSIRMSVDGASPAAPNIQKVAQTLLSCGQGQHVLPTSSCSSSSNTGFPPCSVTPHFQISGDRSEAHLSIILSQVPSGPTSGGKALGITERTRTRAYSENARKGIIILNRGTDRVTRSRRSENIVKKLPLPDCRKQGATSLRRVESCTLLEDAATGGCSKQP